MTYNPQTAENLENYRQDFCPQTPQEAFLAFENFLFFIGLYRAAIR